jgi:hypothetical protein
MPCFGYSRDQRLRKSLDISFLRNLHPPSAIRALIRTQGMTRTMTIRWTRRFHGLNFVCGPALDRQRHRGLHIVIMANGSNFRCSRSVKDNVTGTFLWKSREKCATSTPLNGKSIQEETASCRTRSWSITFTLESQDSRDLPNLLLVSADPIIDSIDSESESAHSPELVQFPLSTLCAVQCRFNV